MLSRLLGLCVLVVGVYAIGQQTCVSFSSSSSSFAIVDLGNAAPVLISADDWPGVQRAASDFVSDIHKVTGVTPSLANATSSYSSKSTPIIVGTLGKSSLIAAVVAHAKLDVSSVNGTWESFKSQVVKNPLPGISEAYVIIGADKRGTIFALYDHSEQFGVSPWYWWADVPVPTHSSLFVSSAGCSHGSPSVKYRGIFINDEQPCIQNWAMEKFTNGTGSALLNSPFNSKFYVNVYELILRLKANYLWPAQWGSAFYIDDPLNAPLADMYGVIMGTSHQEPMQRSTPNEWGIFGSGPWDWTTNAANITAYWTAGVARAAPYDNIITVGMRGLGDVPLSVTEDITLLEGVISAQRQMIQGANPGKNVSEIPQMWCLYQEVQGYYESGLRVPDDVTLLWSDDNWGNIRRIPLANERNRTGGAGVYYHVDYVGNPRDYKWIQSSQISKTYEQMNLAAEADAKRIWILNVGDLKPYHLDIEFFITLGWNTTIWNKDNLDTFVTKWAMRDLGVSAAQASTVATIYANATRLTSRRKPELWNATIYSLTDYREAENVLAEWSTLSQASTKIYQSLSSATQPAYFQFVHHLVEAAGGLGQMWIDAGINNLRASQARLSTNTYADEVETLFEQDWDLENQYHTMLNGKWDHMMDQTHVMYYYWQQPMTNTMPFVTRVQPKKQALPGVMRIVPEGSLGAWPGDNPNQCAQGYNCPPPAIYIDRYLPQPSKFIDIGASGPNSFKFTVKPNVTWLSISALKGSLSSSSPEQRLEISVDWSKVSGVQYAVVNLNATASGQPMESYPVYITANHTTVPSSFHGFVEGDGGIAFEAAHAARNSSVDGITWLELPGYGRTLSGVTTYPRLGNGGNFTAGTGPHLEYDFYTFNTIDGQNITVTALVSPTLNVFGNQEQLSFAMQVDNLAPVTSYPIPLSAPGTTPPQWGGNDGFVANSVVSVPVKFAGRPGAHTLKVFMIEPGIVLQKFVINTGNVRPSYLGPPESVKA